MRESTALDFNNLDIEKLTEGLLQNFKTVENMMTDFSKTYEQMNLDPFNLSELYREWFAAAIQNPAQMAQKNMEFWQNALHLYQRSAMGLMGMETEPVIKEARGDRRFHHEDWAKEPIFRTIKQSYLLVSQWLRSLVADVDGLDKHTAQKVQFFTERLLDAMSPTNFAATNPAVLQRILETKGGSLVHGLKNMMEDLERGQGILKIQMTDTNAFELGKNVAVTPGKVVFQSRMFQLIQYTPTTERVYQRPLLVVPPWINKFYIMDLQPKNSLLRWLVEQGHSVFVISWVNPDESYSDIGFDTYLKEGVLVATDVVEQITGESEMNAIGYCIGGTLLSTTLAYMKAHGDKRIKSSTYFTTMIDFSEPGELGVFIDEDQIGSLEQRMNKEGYLEGSSMAGAFNLMRANDLIWSFYINNYLLGNDPRPFDLLYWNSDSTRMPAKMHSWYLRNMYLNNRLCKAELAIEETPIDLTTVDVPSCFVSTVEDHIAPWLSTYSGAQLFSGPVRFILGGSGHIAGIINPPEAEKYDYRVTDELPADPEEWAAGAEKLPGSWWPEWQRWIAPMSGEMVAARVPGSGSFKALEDAPGAYVKKRLGETVVAPPKPTRAGVTQPNKMKAAPAKRTAVTDDTGEKAWTIKAVVEPRAAVADDLTAISGIGPKLSAVLQKRGITSYAALAAMSADQIKALLLSEGAGYARYDTSTWPQEAERLKAK
ncbi:MAG: class I poly(R)-hydroxyalkanoic acid synthase [Gammaproteobacteria bacterium]|nr:class I poly(R)-hydroxyalkanoic acid synthase [Gammaproteobacteria bacterium]